MHNKGTLIEIKITMKMLISVIVIVVMSRGNNGTIICQNKEIVIILIMCQMLGR